MADWVPLGDRAIRFPRPNVPARALVRAVRAWPGVIDVVVAPRDIAAYFATTPSVDPERVRALATLTDDPAPTRTHALAARYDGPDLAAVAHATGLTVGEVIARHQAATYVVETVGFAPGFGYLVGLDPRLVVPRRATPRARVPAGALAIAATYTAVYPFTSPGGWHLLGHVDTPMFGPTGAVLALGDRVQFVDPPASAR